MSSRAYCQFAAALRDLLPGKKEEERRKCLRMAFANGGSALVEKMAPNLLMGPLWSYRCFEVARYARQAEKEA